MSSKPIRSVGDFKLSYVKLKSVVENKEIDITPLVSEINIYEDIESNFITGVININDIIKISSGIQLIGNEIITFDISTGSDYPIKGNFFVYKIGKKEEITAKLFNYNLYFISVEALYDLNTVLSAPFKGKPHEIAEQMVRAFYTSVGEDLQKNYIYEETVNDVKVIPNFWNPKEVIRFLCDHSINSDGQADFLFYENRNGFNFNSLDIIISNLIENKKPDYSFIKTDNIDFSVGSTSDLNTLYKNVIAISIPESNDYIKNVRSGVYGSLMFAYDVSGQNLFGNVYDPRDGYGNVKHLNPYPIINSTFLVEPAGTVFNRSFSLNVNDDMEDSTNTTWVQHRISRLGSLKNQKTNITVYGRTVYTVGTIANVLIYDTPAGNTSSNKALRQSIDSSNSGNYIVAKIRHHFDISKSEYTCDMELWKDSYIIDHNSKEIN